MPNLEVRAGMDMMVILKERKDQKFALKRKLKVSEAVPIQKEVLQTVGNTFVVVVDDVDN